MYLKYQIQEYDTNNDRPFNMTIYFEKRDSTGNWTAPVWVEDQGRVVNATLYLEHDLMIFDPRSIIPKEMEPYLGGYDRSLDFLANYSPQAQPHSLSTKFWGRIACLSCIELDLNGSQSVTV